jgi:hypothetical protein
LLTLHRFDATEQGRSGERCRSAALTTFTTVVAGAGLVVGTLASFPAQRAQAFTSFLHGNWHGQITWSALRVVMQSGSGCRLSDAAAAVVMNSNINQDLLEMSLDSSDHLVPKTSGHASYANCPVGWEPCPYRPEHHFDRVKSLSEDPSAVESAFESGIHYVVAKRGRIGQMVAENRIRAALIALGRGLHAVQDVFSHSNYVDLYNGRSPATDELTPALLGTDVTAPPTSLLLTRFDWRDANPESPADADAPLDPSYAGFPYTHLRMAKDWDAENAEAGLPIGGKTKFQMAESAATSASVQLILAVIKDSPGFCGQVSNWSPNNPSLDNTDPSDPDEPGKYVPRDGPKDARSVAAGFAFSAGGSEASGGAANPARAVTAGPVGPVSQVTAHGPVEPHPGGGPVAPTDRGRVLDMGGQVFNVKAYGATGSGWVDDGAAILATISAAANAGGGTVFFPSGTYNFASTLTLPLGVPLILEGAGPNSSKLNYAGGNDAIRIETGFVGAFLNVAIRDCTVQGNSNANAVGIHQINTPGVLYDNLAVAFFNGTNGTGILVDNQPSQGANQGGFNERTTFRKVSVWDNTKGIRMVKNGGTFSFFYTRMEEVHIQIPTNGIGFSVENGAFIGNSEIKFFYNGLWTAATAMSITGGSAVDNCFYDIVGEGAKTFLSIDSTSRMTGVGYILQNDGAINLASGAVYIYTGCNLEFGDGACGVRSSNGTWVFPGSQGEASLPMNNGANENVALGLAAFAVVSGPNNNFSIGGFSGGGGGRILNLRSPSVSPGALTVVNQDTASTPGNRICTGTGANVTLPVNADSNVLAFIYDSYQSCWYLWSYH